MQKEVLERAVLLISEISDNEPGARRMVAILRDAGLRAYWKPFNGHT
jgi:hypothetical protein